MLLYIQETFCKHDGISQKLPFLKNPPQNIFAVLSLRLLAWFSVTSILLLGWSESTNYILRCFWLACWLQGGWISYKYSIVASCCWLAVGFFSLLGCDACICDLSVLGRLLLLLVGFVIILYICNTRVPWGNMMSGWMDGWTASRLWRSGLWRWPGIASCRARGA